MGIYRTSHSGFTLIEILLVIGTLGILAGLGTAAFSSFNRHQAIDKSRAIVLGALHQARSMTMASVKDRRYGMFFETKRVVLFNGDSYVANDPENRAINLYQSVSISNISLSDGGSTVLFEKKKGLSSVSGTVTFTLSSGGETRRINIYKTGLAD